MNYVIYFFQLLLSWVHEISLLQLGSTYTLIRCSLLLIFSLEAQLSVLRSSPSPAAYVVDVAADGGALTGSKQAQ